MPKLSIRRGAIATIAALGLMAGVASCATTPAEGDDLTTVKVGISPYFEYQPWVLADELGLDAELGIDLEFTSYDSTDKAVIGAYRGDVDIASNCLVCTFSLVEQVPEIQDFMITNQFKGFILIGRAGETSTFEEERVALGDEAAKEKVLKELKGKSFAIRSSSYQALLSAALAQVGMTIDDIEIVDFSSDSQAGIAFAGGTGDYYIGSLPQEAKLLESPEKYVNVGGSDILGPAGLWFSSMSAKSDWLSENSETVDKLLAIWYRTMRYMQEQSDEVMPIYTEAVNAATSSDLSVETVTTIVNDLERFATLPQAEEEFFSPTSATYYKSSVDFYELDNQDNLPADYSQEKTITIVPTIEEFKKNAELLEWVDSPL